MYVYGMVLFLFCFFACHCLTLYLQFLLFPEGEIYEAYDYCFCFVCLFFFNQSINTNPCQCSITAGSVSYFFLLFVYFLGVSVGASAF